MPTRRLAAPPTPTSSSAGAAAAGSSAATGAAGRAPAGRWFRAAPAQRTLLWASLAVVLGAFLPWVITPVGSLPGLQGGGLVTMYAASLGVAGALVARPLLAVAQGALTGLVAVGVAGWQLVEVLGAGADGLAVGLGVPVTLVAGAAALRAAVLVQRQGAAVWTART